MSVKLYSLSEKEIKKIGEAFADYKYASGEYGMGYLCKGRDSISDYISQYARTMLKEGYLYTTSENHEGFVAMHRYDQKFGFDAGIQLFRGIHGNWSLINAGKMMVGYAKRNSEKSYKSMLMKLKIPFIYVGMVAVLKEYQGMGFMRQTLEIAFEEARKHRMPVVLETDAVLKRDKYIHLGMKCVAIQSFVEGVELYSLVYEPDTLPEDFKSEEVIKRYKAVVAKDKDVWDKFAPIYKFFINASLSNRKAYSAIYGRIRKVAINKEVLELATGPGMIAKEVADVTRTMIATDFSEKMLEQARRGMNPPNLVFEQADASNLRYGDSSFDVVIISNALHIIPDSGKVLEEIKRVLRPGGILIAPNFIHNNDDKLSKLSSNVLKKSGITFEVEWDEEGYKKFLEDNGFKVVNSHVFPSTIPLMYTECKKKE